MIAVYSFIAEEQATGDNDWSVAEMCRTLGVARSGFYDWLSRPLCERDATDAQLAVRARLVAR